MASVAVTILADTPEDFAARVDRVKPFAKRIHIDVTDGVFAPAKTLGLSQVYKLDGAQLDLHMMVEYPQSEVENMLALEPNLVILHFESQGDHLVEAFKQFKDVGIATGLAIKSSTTIDEVKDLLRELDHLLVFTGNLGYNGGEMDLACLEKIGQAKAINPHLEIGVDGGVNAQTAKLALDAGADVLDVGSFVHDSADPAAAYAGLMTLAGAMT